MQILTRVILASRVRKRRSRLIAPDAGKALLTSVALHVLVSGRIEASVRHLPVPRTLDPDRLLAAIALHRRRLGSALAKVSAL